MELLQRKTFLLFIFLPVLIFSQDKTDKNYNPFRIGVWAGPNYVMNSTSIPVIPGAEDCGNYENGSAPAFFAGITYTYKFLPKLLWLEGRLFYESRPASLQTETTGFEVYQESSDSYEPLIRSHEFDAPLQYISLDIGARVNPLENIPVFARISFDAGNPLVNSSFTNDEEIVSPGNINFPDQTKRHSVESGDLKTAGTAIGAALSIGYEFKLKGGMILSPEISYRKGLNSVTSTYDWNTDIIRAGISVTWEYGGDEEEVIIPEKEVEEPVIIEPEKKILVERKPEILSIDAEELVFTETVVTQTYPLLPYIFFDSASVELKDVYVSTDKLDIESQLPKNSLKIYYKSLDIIGTRMKDNPNSSLTVIGVTDGFEMPDSANREKLALSRAKNIVKYLQNKYDIAGNRFNIDTRDRPLNPTSSRYNEGPEENRRVEFIASNSKILEPVIHSRFIEYKTPEKTIDISNKFEGTDEIDSVRVEILKGGNVIMSELHPGNASDFSFPIDNEMINSLGDAATYNTNTNIRTTIYGNNKELDTKIARLPVRSDRNKFELGRLNLIVFDFDKSVISSTNKVMIEDFINTNISNDSEIKITGSTDRLGEKEYNKQLSKERAETVEKYITKYKKNADITEVRGIGSSELPFDNNLPEGRFYCRTVLIEVKTPLENK